MTGFAIETKTTAPDASREVLAGIEANLGFIPNVYGVFAGVPAALHALAALNMNFEETSFTAAEREIIALTTSVFNQCPYCVAGHSIFALEQGVDQATIDAIRTGDLSVDPRLHAIGRMTRDILEKKGSLGVAEIRPFLNAGFQPAQILELLIGVAGKMMTNFASKITRVPLDPAFADQAWSPTDSATSNAA